MEKNSLVETHQGFNKRNYWVAFNKNKNAHQWRSTSGSSERLVRLENCNWLLILYHEIVSDAFDVYRIKYSPTDCTFFSLILNDIIGGMFMNGGFKKSATTRNNFFGSDNVQCIFYAAVDDLSHSQHFFSIFIYSNAKFPPTILLLLLSRCRSLSRSID